MSEKNVSSACCQPTVDRNSAGMCCEQPENNMLAQRPLNRGLCVMVPVMAGCYDVGSDNGQSGDGEGPHRTIEMSDFLIDATAVTNRQFLEFVRETGYQTDAQKLGWSFVFAAQIHPKAVGAIQTDLVVPRSPWWMAVKGACWHSPDGPGSDIQDQLDHPVVHVSWSDASAFATWAGKQLPTEAQWEVAARGGLRNMQFPWGNELTPDGRHRCNIWQGQFPDENTAADGYLGTAPAESFEPNELGVYNAVGNVWEWCADWWSTDWHAPATFNTRHNPVGPSSGTSKAMRGGSYLCHSSYCDRYRVSARTFSTLDSSTSHVGFRCASRQI